MLEGVVFDSNPDSIVRLLGMIKDGLMSFKLLTPREQSLVNKAIASLSEYEELC
jgi:hypothetical protein